MSAAAEVRRARERELIERAKDAVDLPGFLAGHGWRAVPGKDTARWRSLVGPDGTRILAWQPPGGQRWFWTDARNPNPEGKGKTIVDACMELLRLAWGQTLAALRRALASLPAPLPVAAIHPVHAMAVTSVAAALGEQEPTEIAAVATSKRLAAYEDAHSDPRKSVEASAPIEVETEASTAAQDEFEAHDQDEDEEPERSRGGMRM